MLIYDHALDPADRLALEAYLGEKYGLTSPVPTQGLRLWLSADTGVVAGEFGQVSRWLDRSGHGHDLVQPDAKRQPILVSDAANGLPAIRLDGVDDHLERPDVLCIAPESGREMIVVASLGDPARRAPLVLQGSSVDAGLTYGVEANPPGSVDQRFGVSVTGSAYDGTTPIDDRFNLHLLSSSTLTAGAAIAGTTEYHVNGNPQALTLRGAGSGVHLSFLGADTTTVGYWRAVEDLSARMGITTAEAVGPYASLPRRWRGTDSWTSAEDAAGVPDGFASTRSI